MRKLFVVIVIFGVLGKASVLWGECAWVLWIKNEVTLSTPSGEGRVRFEDSAQWELQTASESKDECDVIKEKVWGAVAKEYDDAGKWKSKFIGLEKVTKVPFNGIFRSFKASKSNPAGGHHNTILYCLPDTIDPRK